MRKLVLIIFVAICTVAYSQNHFAGAFYLDGSVGISDQKAFLPSIGIGYNFSDRWSVNGCYKYKSPSQADKYRFFEHSLDIFGKYAIFQKNYFSINLLAGFSQSINKYTELPRPSFSPKVYNIGYVAGVEAEYFINNNMALFSSVNNKGYFLDNSHFELSYSLGIRVDFSVFSKQLYHPAIH
ncbi:MAG TPA: hypothetical protein VFD03_06380 [Clostridia bacterium]|nr:hypothetical protein [Clostridia bacterium]